MNTMVFILSLIIAPAFFRPAQGAEPETAKAPVKPEACDMSVVDPAIAKKNWKSADGKEWTALKMDNGFALCLFSDRYMLFKEGIGSLSSVSVENGEISVMMSAPAKHSYLVNAADFIYAALPYRGFPCESAYWARLDYESPASTIAAAVTFRTGSSPGQRLEKVLRRFAAANSLWSNPEVVKKAAQWLMEERGKESLESLRNFEPQVKLIMNVSVPPPGASAQSTATVKGQTADKSAQAPVSSGIDAASFICGDPAHYTEKSPHKSFNTADTGIAAPQTQTPSKQ
ncbi:MAG: hypothetical protein ABIG11_08130 [bacterium]